MTLKSSVGILILCVYSVILSISQSLNLFMSIPLFLEILRNKKYILLIFKKLLLLNVFIGLIAICVYFSDSNLALLIFLRSNMVVLFALLMFVDKDYFDISYGLQQLRVPNLISSLFYFSAKFIYLLHQEIKIFNKNLLLRGFVPKTNMLTYKTYANFVGMLFVQALNKANTLNNMLVLRGYNGTVHTLKKQEKINLYEFILIVVTLISLLVGYFI